MSVLDLVERDADALDDVNIIEFINGAKEGDGYAQALMRDVNIRIIQDMRPYGYPYKLAIMDVRGLVVPTIQRLVLAKHVKEIVEAYTKALIVPLVVNLRDTGEYAVLDGLQRMTASILVENYELPIILYEGLEWREQDGPRNEPRGWHEAHIFCDLNGRRVQVNSYYQHRANAFSGDPTDWEIKHVLGINGWKTTGNKNENKPQVVNGIGYVKNKLISKRYNSNSGYDGLRAFTKAIEIINAAWFNYQGNGQTDTIRLVGDLYYEYGHQIDDKRLIEYLVANPIGVLQSNKEIRAIKRKVTGGESKYGLLLEMVVEEYNRSVWGSGAKRLRKK